MKRKSSSKKTTYNEDAASEDSEDIRQNGGSEDDADQSSTSSKKHKGRGRPSKGQKNGEAPEEENSASEADDPLATASEEDAEYEVQEVLDEKKIRGKTHYLIRWKGYTEEEDTWEPESTLTCDTLIQAFKNKKNDSQGSSSTKNKDKGGKKKKDGKSRKADDEDEDIDDSKDYEVARIKDVHFCRDGTKEFLIHWKGYTADDDTWEPEDNLDCKDLIKKFMEKVEKAQQADTKELRVNRKPVERLNFAMHETGRKLSKRHRGQQRVTYYDAE